MTNSRVAALRIGEDLSGAVREALEFTGILDKIGPETRVALKPNFTYPYYKPGVTTSPEVIIETIKTLMNRTSNIFIVETEGGYGAWRAGDAFRGHGVYEMEKEYGVKAINLNEEDTESIEVSKGSKRIYISLPTRLLHETDVLISMPVPKIHCMTGLSLGYKNQWGCIPDIMRLRRHHMFSEAIVAINRALKPVVLADGTYFLDDNGPMDGKPVRMDLLIAGTSAGAFDLYVSALMGVSWKKIAHLRKAVKLEDMPSCLEDIEYNVHPNEIKKHNFQLKRTVRNYIALAGFKSRFITWLGYEAWFGRVILHKILYAFAGKPVRPKED